MNVCPAPGVASPVAAGAQTCPVTVKLKDITFGGSGSIGVFTEAPPCAGKKCWGTTFTVPPPGPDWKAEMNPNLAVAYVRGTTMRLTVFLAAHGSPEGTATLRVTGPDGLTGEGTFNVSGCQPGDRVVAIETNALPNVVRAYTRMGLSWSIKEPGATTFRHIKNTSHLVYVLLGPPTGGSAPLHVPTARRLNFVCNAAAMAGTALEAIDGGVFGGGMGIHERLADDPPFDANDPGVTNVNVNDWSLMAGLPSGGECDEQAVFMTTVVSLVGGPVGTSYFTWPSRDCDPRQPEIASAADAGITWDIDGDGTIGEESVVLRFDFAGGDGTGINAFEGSVAYTTLGPSPGTYYAVWPSLRATSKCKLLLQVRDHPIAFGEEPVVQCWAASNNPWVCLINPATGKIEKIPFPTCSTGCP